MPKSIVGYTVVQHSAYGYKQKLEFKAGLEPRMLDSAAQRRAVEKAGGIVFPTYGGADDFCHEAMYPPGVEGLIPQAKGTFSAYKVDGLAVYVPIRQVIG